MALVLSLQGGMAVGKTTAARWLAAHEPRIRVLEEDISVPVAEVRRLGLDKHCFADYLTIQRLFIQNEITRWEAAQSFSCVVTDLGAGEIEFYTLHYPASIGMDWPVALALAPELAALRRCRAQHTLFLDASPAALCARKEADTSRDRTFFDHSLTRLLPVKRHWFAAQPGTEFLTTDTLTPAQLCRAVHTWVLRCMAAPQPKETGYGTDQTESFG